MRLRNGLALLCFLAAASALAAPQKPKTPVMHDPELIDGQGYQKLVQQYRGKALVVNFWATYCEPCRDEYPMLNELAKKYAPQGLKLIGVTLDQDGDLVLMRRFIARYQPIFPNYRKKPEEAENAFDTAVLPGWNGSLPITIFYAKDGRQVGNFVGERSREAYEAAIRALLGPGSH